MIGDVRLREVREDDLAIFFAHHRDPDARHMAAFTARDPADHVAFLAHWHRILDDETIIIRTIICDGQVAGHVLSFVESDRQEVSYWIGREFWGRGIATAALTRFLRQALTTRPVYARVAKDNVASIRVLEKCGFVIVGEDRGFANARGGEIEEFVMELEAGEAG